MSKEIQMSFKLEPELKAQFAAATAENHRPAAQVMRDLMRLYIASRGKPVTAEAIRTSVDVVHPARDEAVPA